ncbi:MAG: ABC transporter ATP-binding protein [Bacteroidia bacterium]|nr:ABC transporter ATP-binding protein [Bacteroidia bacterium]NND11361.1 ABC transporter ATP-binding protein [Flavobacteriaceae bacterium]MBT8310801.1 ABC transporter ATP-binding protein [Bacteroidia bacterium]NNK28958.1 ABC transporter ATP-binding protein [Flavobacteriaceae bacterium]NNL60221.1 ABC transporter ATP-binding protein [Flavobacteriaceae bacterium]
MLRVENVSFGYSEKPVLKDLDFQVMPGENLAVIGESGSGKSTLLKIIFGEFDFDEGHIFWKDQEILGPKFNLVVGYDFMKQVSQEFDLMPFTSVEENVGKFLSNFFPEEKKDRTAELLEVVELSAFSKTKVKLLSGGQKQRVALARSIAIQPEILLLDEPFSHIDNFKKQSLRRNLFRYLKEHNIACIVATHDKDDVLGFADNMIVLSDSRIMANDRPSQLYNDPKDSLIASFFGEFNRIQNKIVYAHQLKIVPSSQLKVVVEKSYFKGNHYLIEAIMKEDSIFFEHPTKVKKGNTVCLAVNKH